VDALWVRGLGVEATAAVTTSIFVMWSVYSLHDVFGVGVSAYVSQLLGSGDRARAGLVAYRGMRAVAIMGLICGGLGLFGAQRVYELMGAPPGVTENGTSYLTIVLGASVLPLTMFTSETIMRAAGNTRLPLMVDVLAISLNAALDPLLIYGWGPFPRLGVAGAAWATVIAQAAAVASYAVIAWRGHPALPFSRRAPGLPVTIRSLARVGVPSALIGMMFSLVYIAFSRSAARFGAASLAIVGIANRIEALQFLTSISIGIAGSTLVGQNLGAGRPDRAVRAIRIGVVWSVIVALGLTALVYAVPGFFLELFTRDAEALRVGVPYLRILATCLIAVGVEIVVFESVLGSGHTRVPSLIYNAFSLIRIPLAFWLPQRMHNGVLGIAWLITITCNMRALLIVLWAARGTWKRGLAREIAGEAPGAPPATPASLDPGAASGPPAPA
jgi:putative MATE family efflux protein